jgi:hypothetical protein
MAHSFDDNLPILPEGPIDRRILQMFPGVRLGVCAMGPVTDGDEVLASRVWVFQQEGQHVAAASGKAGEHLGGHPQEPVEDLPFRGRVKEDEDEGRWMIQTQLEEHSDEFKAGVGALATAMALVKHKDGTKDVVHWSRAVMIGEPHEHPHPTT